MVKRKKTNGTKEDKTMKKNILSMAALLMASATVFTGCSNDDNIIDEQPAVTSQQTYTMTIEASKGGDGTTTRALSIDDSGAKNVLNATWATSEKVYVKKDDTWATGSLKPEADGATATLRGTLSGIEIAADDVLTLQFPKSGEISYAGQVGTLEDIAANFDYATATVTVASVSATGNIIPEAATTTFENQQAIVKFTLRDKSDGTTSLSASELTVRDGASTYTVTPASATSVIYAAIPGFSGQTVTLTATVGGKTYTYEKSGVSFTNGKYYEITVKMKMIPEGAISGKFTINGSGTQVYFSKGNLQYQASTSTWRFAENQWDYVGDNTNGNVYVSSTKSSNASISNTYTGWIDLFGWGTSGHSFASGYGSAYQPWSTSTTSTAYGPTDGTSSLTGTYAQGDWGTNMGSGWRTLTSDEWEYIFNTRAASTVNSVENARYAKATVAGKTGMILFPDTYTHPSDVTQQPTSINTANAAFTSNSYDATAWGKMEAAGCIFLPAAGYRYSTNVYGVGSYGDYWSSKPNDTNYAYGVLFSASVVGPQNSSRYYGYSVRLVRDAQ